jgi:hypothetical protein
MNPAHAYLNHLTRRQFFAGAGLAMGGVALDLYPRTLIVGPNGAGKDAILASVALALTGIADDYTRKRVDAALAAVPPQPVPTAAIIAPAVCWACSQGTSARERASTGRGLRHSAGKYTTSKGPASASAIVGASGTPA